MARILADEVTVRLHTGLSVGFRQTTRAVTRVRGRINVLTTERHQLLSEARVSCTFDEIVTDTPANRLAKAALEKAAALVPGQPRYRSLALQLGAAGVRGPCPPLGTVSAMQRQRLLGRDRQMIAAAELLLTLAIPTTDSGNNACCPSPPWTTTTSASCSSMRRAASTVTDSRRRAGRVKHGQAPEVGHLRASPGMRQSFPG